MFTGIIKKVGVIHSWNAKSRILGIKSEFDNLILGESISCSGVCLTVSSFKKDLFFINIPDLLLGTIVFSERLILSLHIFKPE